MSFVAVRLDRNIHDSLVMKYTVTSFEFTPDDWSSYVSLPREPLFHGRASSRFRIRSYPRITNGQVRRALSQGIHFPVDGAGSWVLDDGINFHASGSSTCYKGMLGALKARCMIKSVQETIRLDGNLREPFFRLGLGKYSCCIASQSLYFAVLSFFPLFVPLKSLYVYGNRGGVSRVGYPLDVVWRLFLGRIFNWESSCYRT